jgi:alpha-galactosidase
MKALLGLSEIVTNVNIPNIGQAEGLPIGAVVETNSVFSKNAVRPVFAGKLPDAVNTIVSKHAVNQQLLIEAGVKKDIELAFHVFLNDNLMTLDIKDAEKLFGEMTDNTKKYLSGWDRVFY